MFYRYWKEEVLEEHLLLPGEIAQIWGIKSSTGKPHSQLTSYLLKRYCEERNIKPLCYLSASGMLAVYSIDVYIPAFQWFLEQVDHKLEGTVKGNKKNYKYKVTVRTKETDAVNI